MISVDVVSQALSTKISEEISGRDKFLLDYIVSHETALAFDRYAALLNEWQEKMNLVAPSTLPIIWQRHFADSAQLFALLPRNAMCLVDIGSGAGFPGLVLALMARAVGRPLQIHLVESVQKKAQFLNAVAEDLGLSVIVHPERTENLHSLAADVVTARALGALPDLFRLVQPFLQPHTQLLFLKGVSVDDELTKARMNWHFDCRMIPSKTDAGGRVLKIERLQFKTTKTRRHNRGD